MFLRLQTALNSVNRTIAHEHNESAFEFIPCCLGVRTEVRYKLACKKCTDFLNISLSENSHITAVKKSLNHYSKYIQDR